jgi:hypothetical protein
MALSGGTWRNRRSWRLAAVKDAARRVAAMAYDHP